MSFLRNNRAALMLFFMGIAFLALGVWRDEAQTVYRKAVTICMECIGLG